MLNHLTTPSALLHFVFSGLRGAFAAPLPSYDQNIAAAGAEADRVAWADHVEEFRRVRLSTISLFRNMPPEAWLRRGMASDNPFTVRALAFITAGHLTHHLSDICGNDIYKTAEFCRTPRGACFRCCCRF